jgi:hypothetical protein
MSETVWDREFDEQVGNEEGWIESETETREEPLSREILGLLNLGKY